MEEFDRCSVCTRTPLVGEGVTVLGRGRREELICDLCLAKPRAAAAAESGRRERMRSVAGAANVQRIYPTPVGGRKSGRPDRIRPAPAV